MKIVKQFSAFNKEPEDAMNLLEENINAFVEDQDLDIILISHSLDRYEIDKETGFICVASALVVCINKTTTIVDNNFALGA